MPAPPELEDFDQTERHTARLRDLVRSYPKGLGLVKEFLQNADDAGASFLHITYDRRRHPGPMDNVEQEVVLGPALLLANDSPFTEQDIKNIQHIGGGGKLNEARGTGRFGYGFNTSFSVSDHPTLLTGDTVVWFDPHQRAHGARRNAWAWRIKGVNQSWPAWMATFVPGGYVPQSARFNGTIFRLPLRTAEDARRSEILAEAFTGSDFENILDEARQVGPALLVFLRSVQTLRIDEITLNGTRRERLCLETLNAPEVEAQRARVRDAVRGDPSVLLDKWLRSDESLPLAMYRHTFRLSIGRKAKELTWIVVTGLFRGQDNQLLRHAQVVCSQSQKEKALPWAGAATSIDKDEAARGLACFLPLPESAAWPILLHGWFDLDSGRHGITRQTGTGETAPIRARWNIELLRHGVGPACAMLVEQLRGRAQENADPYRLWLQPSDAKDDYDRALIEGFYAEIAARSVFRCVSSEGYAWCSIAEMDEICWNLTAKWHDVLREPFLTDGDTFIEPSLPDFIIKGLRDVAHPVRIASADTLRATMQPLSNGVDINCPLHEAPWMSLRRREWVIAQAHFCAQDGLEKLAGLPLALLADGRLHTFGKCGTIYLLSDAERSLLAKLPHRMLDSQFEREIGLAGPISALGVKKFDVPALVACVQELLTAAPPDEAWLIELFDYMEQLPPQAVNRYRSAIQDLMIVPDQQGRRWRMGYANTPVLLQRVPAALMKALNRLGVPLVAGSENLSASIKRFALRHPDFVWELSPERLATALASHIKTPWIQEKALTDRAILTALLDYLSPPDWFVPNDWRKEALRRLPMLPTTDGSIVTAEVKDLYVPGDFEPPHTFVVQQKLLELGDRDKWMALYRALSVPELDSFAFVFDLMSAFQHATPGAQLQMLRWLRDHLAGIEKTLSPERRKSLRNKVQMTAILPIRGGTLQKPRDLYRPDAIEAVALLGSVAQVPDLELLGDEPEQWNSFFINLGLHTNPQAEHLIEAIQRCVSASRVEGIERVIDRLHALRKYVHNHWDRLGNHEKGGTKKFADALASVAWLPAVAPSVKVACIRRSEHRLYKANELAAPRLLHLIASVRPVLDGPSFPSDMEEALGLHTQVLVDEVLRHFAAVRAATNDEATPEACGKAFVSFVQYIAELSEAMKRACAPRLAALSDVSCVLMRGKWWRPQRVFLESLAFATDWCVSVLEDPIVASQPRIWEGLRGLGVRSKPTSLDWVDMLHEQQSRAAGRPLTESELMQVRGALQQLRIEDREWLRSQPVRVPTVDGQLLPATEALLPDDPRLKRVERLCILPLVEETEVSLEIARAAGARSLRQVLVDELSEEPNPSEDSSVLEWADECARVVRSPLFYEGLRRLAWHEATERGEDPAASASDEKLILAKRIILRVVRTLRVTSSFRDTGTIVFEQKASSFWDSKSDILWLSAGGRSKMRDDLARTLANECGVDALRLSRMLEANPEGIASLLDEDNIAMIPEGVEGAVAPQWVEPEHLSVKPWRGVPDDDSNSDASESINGDETNWPPAENEAPEHRASDWESKGIHTGNGVPSITSNEISRHYSNGGRSGERLSLGNSSGNTRSAEGFMSPPNPAGAPTTPGFGSSRPWTPDAHPHPTDGTRRLRSYVHREEQSDYDTNLHGANPFSPADQEAVRHVIEWERAQGRTPVEPPHGILGYDVESSCSNGMRYIKVCGIDGPWTARGVRVTGPNQRKAVELGTKWWLYVVEHARDPNRATVHDIRNPFLDATEYRFDNGWCQPGVAKEAKSKDPIEGEEITLEDGSTAIVVEAERRGELWRVTLKFANGDERPCAWDPTWRRG